MNESHLSLLDGGQQRSGTVNTKPPQTCPLHTSANQERVKKPSEEWNRRVKVEGEKMTLDGLSVDSEHHSTSWTFSD